MLLNLGPVHPSTHGVLRCIVLLNSELINYINIEIGLLHRGSEKLIELNYYYLSLPYFDRFDYVSIVSQELLFINALERIFNSYLSLFDSLVRILLVEIYRILNHSLAITTHAIDLGLFSSMLWFFEEREKLFNLVESLSGSRFHLAYLFIGRNRFNISLSFIESLFLFLLYFVRRLFEMFNILSINSIWIKRLYEIGIINLSLVIFYCFSGLIARSSGLLIDGRLLGYESYCLLSFNTYLSFNGDSLDRYLNRFNEMLESSRIIYLSMYYCLFAISGFTSFNASSSSYFSTGGSETTARYALQGFNRFLTMEDTIYSFLFNFSLFNSSFSSFKVSIESSKGLYSLFINSYPSYSINVISSDFLLINQVNKFSKNINLSDFITILGSVDFVLGSVDL